MTRVMREFGSPEIRHDELTPRPDAADHAAADDERLTHVRVTHAIFPAHLRDPAVARR